MDGEEDHDGWFGREHRRPIAPRSDHDRCCAAAGEEGGGAGECRRVRTQTGISGDGGGSAQRARARAHRRIIARHGGGVGAAGGALQGLELPELHRCCSGLVRLLGAVD